MGKDPVTFTSYTYGRLAGKIHLGRGQEFDKIFIPDGDKRTFSCMSYEEQLSYFDNIPTPLIDSAINLNNPNRKDPPITMGNTIRSCYFSDDFIIFYSNRFNLIFIRKTTINLLWRKW